MGNEHLTSQQLLDVISQQSAELHEQDQTINTLFWAVGFAAIAILSLIVLIIYK